MEAKDFLFQNTDGSYNFGRSKTSPCPSGGHRLDHVEGNETFTIRDRSNNDNDVGGVNRSPAEFMDINGTPYANFAAFYAACKGFFFRRSELISMPAGMVITDTSTGLKLRIILRGSAICFDKELTATGFAGTQDVDWKEAGSFGSDV